ncbi:hypothetical protein [Candidatus Nanohalococcus occultus]|uniref:Uncharacterized protein n=1 Tax=Candidatus Nanohalococcus occultus TaxID=2978047 RepID=A0ABY8CHX7_9ARCH|nr:hypothetical protein SVXNc_0256 [Candidatus Nanohaloarchaeota archaeon SVXNc]
MKAQSSIEFLSLVSMSALLLAALHGFVSAKQAQLVQTEETRTAEQVAEKTSFQVEMALIQGKGYSRVFNVPKEISGSEYKVKTGEGESFVSYEDENVFTASRYQGEWINISTSDSTVFKVVNNGSVHIIPQ